MSGEDLTAGAPRVSRRAAAGVVVAALAALIVGLSWALASPPGSSPDEDYHLGSIWCAWGESPGLCAEAPPAADGGRAVTAPPVAGFPVCFAFESATSAACQLPAAGSLSPQRADAGSYPPGFYSVMRIFASEEGARSVLVMRMVSFLLCLGMLVASLLLIAGREAWRIGLYWLVAAVPLGIFLFASVNPGGVAVAATTAVFPSALALFRARTRRRAVIAGAAVAALVAIAAMTRPDGLHYAVPAVLVGALLGLPIARRRSIGAVTWPEGIGVRLRTAAPGLVPVVVVGILVLLTRSTSAESTITTAQVGVERAPVSLLTNLTELPALYVGGISTVLGWLDTPMPAAVWGVRALLLGAIVAIGMRRPRARRLVAAAVLGLLLLTVPMLILQGGNYLVGEWVQARYMLSLVLVGVAVFAVNLRQDRVPLSPARAWGLALGVIVVHAVALHALMQRFITGTDAIRWDLEFAREWWWWPDSVIGPNTAWLAGAIAFAVLVCLVTPMSQSRSRTRPAPVPVEPSATDELAVAPVSATPAVRDTGARQAPQRRQDPSDAAMHAAGHGPQVRG